MALPENKALFSVADFSSKISAHGLASPNKFEVVFTRIPIEVDGVRWHTDLSGARLERDIVRDRNLHSMGWDVIRFWVHDLKYDLKHCIDLVKIKLNENE